jgi:hypothetical protein
LGSKRWLCTRPWAEKNGNKSRLCRGGRHDSQYATGTEVIPAEPGLLVHKDEKHGHMHVVPGPSCESRYRLPHARPSYPYAISGSTIANHLRIAPHPRHMPPSRFLRWPLDNHLEFAVPKRRLPQLAHFEWAGVCVRGNVEHETLHCTESSRRRALPGYTSSSQQPVDQIGRSRLRELNRAHTVEIDIVGHKSIFNVGSMKITLKLQHCAGIVVTYLVVRLPAQQ